MASSGAVRPSIGPILNVSRSSRAPTSLLLSSSSAGNPCATPSFFFSTSSPRLVMPRHRKPTNERNNNDKNKHRGESSMRRSGTRWRLSVSDVKLPSPVPRADLPPVENDEKHGLWEFFSDRRLVVNTPIKDAQHGREWTVEELRPKSWEDLHRLWWVCVKERNRIATAKRERTTQKLGFGDSEAARRDRTVRMTMRNIKHALTERFYAWEDAHKLAQSDPEITFKGKRVTFTPSSHLEESMDAEDMGYLEEAGKSESTQAVSDPTSLESPSKHAQEAPKI